MYRHVHIIKTIVVFVLTIFKADELAMDKGAIDLRLSDAKAGRALMAFPTLWRTYIVIERQSALVKFAISTRLAAEMQRIEKCLSNNLTLPVFQLVITYCTANQILVNNKWHMMCFANPTVWRISPESIVVETYRSACDWRSEPIGGCWDEKEWGVGKLDHGVYVVVE